MSSIRWAAAIMIEKPDAGLADKAWEIIEEVEAMGGMTKAVAAGWPKAMIEDGRAAQAGADRPRRGRDRRRQQRNLLRDGRGLRPLWHQPTPVKGVYAAPYRRRRALAQVLDGVQAVERRLGRKPRMLVAKMGQDGHDRGANVIASAFGDMGFDVVSGPLFQTPEETAVLALESDVDVVGASSARGGAQDADPRTDQPVLREAGSDIKVVAGGVIPPQDYDFLREAGVQGIYGPGIQRGRMRGGRAAAARPQYAATRRSCRIRHRAWHWASPSMN
jgi:methylmalonyl-CoA mutase cobalamin-binding domain/chain